MSEKNQVQLPFLKILEGLGYETLLPVDDMFKMNDHALRQSIRQELSKLRYNESTPILTTVLKAQLLKLNDFLLPDQADEVIKDLLKISNSSVVQNNKKYFAYIVNFGYSIKVNGKDRTVKFIDFINSKNNRFHAVPEFYLRDHEDCYLDLQGFINGLPIFTKEDKIPGKLESALEEIVVHYADKHSQRRGCPKLFNYSALLIASDGATCLFGTISGYPTHWSVWKDSNKQVEEDQQNTLAKDLLNPETLLKYLFGYVLHSSDTIIAAKYHQFYSTEILKEETSKPQTEREDSLNFKSQGSGKTYDQVFYANVMRKDPALAIKQVYWQDRTVLSNNLIQDLYAFLPGGSLVIKEARSSKELEKLLKSPGSEIIVSLIQKVRSFDFANKSNNIVNIFDEAQRSQMGVLRSIVDKTMKNSFKIGHSGTPVADTLGLFGRPKYAYTYRDSIEDGATVPVIYKGVQVVVDEHTNLIDLIEQEHFNKIPKQYKDRLYTETVTPENLNQAQARINKISEYIIKDFKQFLDTPYKAFVRASSRISAYLYYAELCRLIALDPAFKGVEVELVISKEPKKETKNPYKTAMKKFSDPERVKKVLYKNVGGDESFESVKSKVRILVMVDIGAEGYNVPSADICYNDNKVSMESHHNAWQFATRPNRAFTFTDSKGRKFTKEFCYFVDFANILDVLNKAISIYSSNNLDGYDIALQDVSNLKKDLKEAYEKFDSLWSKLDKKNHSEKEFKEVDKTYLKVKKLIEALLPNPEAKKYLDKFKPKEKAFMFLKAKKNSDGTYTLYKIEYGPKIIKEAQDNVFVKSLDVVVNGVELTSDKYQEVLTLVEESGEEEGKALAYTNTVKRHIEAQKDSDPEGTKKLSQVVDEVLKRMEGNWVEIIKAMKEIIKKTQTLTPEEDRLGLTLRSRPLLNDFKAILEIFGEAFTPAREEEFKNFMESLKHTFNSVADIRVNLDVRNTKIKELSEEFKDEFDEKKDSEGKFKGKNWKECQKEVQVHLNHMMDGVIKGL